MMRRAGVITSIVFATVILVIVVGAVIFTRQLSAPSPDDTTTKSFVVSQGESVTTIAAHLHDEGLIRNPTAFTIYTKIEQVASRLQAGDYELSPSQSVAEILVVLTDGNADANTVTVRFLEGWTSRQMGDYLESQGLFSAEEWMDAVHSTDSRRILPGETFSFLVDKPASADLEGYLYPDTYKVFRDATPADVIRKMFETFDARVTPERIAQIQAQGKTLFEIVTLASILEREVRTDSDRKKAADVFWKRIRDGIPLQSDATVNYVTGKAATQPTFDDLAVDSPYNTYKYPGLPPGPISNPSITSIVAAIEPEANPYYYFLTAPTGETIFSETFDEHRVNKAKYLGP